MSSDDYLQTTKIFITTIYKAQQNVSSNFNNVIFNFLAGFRRNAQPSVVFQGTDRPGCCEKAVPYQISDDNVAEPDEILTISIARAITSASIPVRFEVQRVNVTIIDNDGE